MEPPDALCAVAPGAQQLRDGIPVSERAAQPSKIVLAIGQHMSPTQVEQLDAVLESTQEPVRQREALAVLSPDVAVVDQRLECRQGSSPAPRRARPSARSSPRNPDRVHDRQHWASL